MRFEVGDEIDGALLISLQHEFMRCEDSFKEFTVYAGKMIMEGRTRLLSYRSYNAYARFIHHLYEFLLGCAARQRKNTNIINERGSKRTKYIDAVINNYAQQCFDNWADNVKNGRAPNWANHHSFYDITVPKEFASTFRRFRNKVSGHVSYERAHDLNLSEFYQDYHKFLIYLYTDSLYMWSVENRDIPDLSFITEFSLAVEESASSDET